MSDWPYHLCAVVNNQGFHCHSVATLLVLPQEPTLAKVEADRYIQTCNQHVAKAARDLLAQGVGWVSLVPHDGKGN